MCSEINVYVYCLNGPALTDFHITTNTWLFPCVVCGRLLSHESGQIAFFVRFGCNTEKRYRQNHFQLSTNYHEIINGINFQVTM